jgi:hypothetical protein
MNELNLTYRRLNSFVVSFDFIPIMVVPWGEFSLCHTPIRPISILQESDLNRDCELCDHVIMRFTLVGIRARLRNKVISFCYFYFLSVLFSFSVFASFNFSFCVCGI